MREHASIILRGYHSQSGFAGVETILCLDVYIVFEGIGGVKPAYYYLVLYRSNQLGSKRSRSKA